MSIIVQKFGGTSVRDESSRQALLHHVRRCKEDGHDVVVVVSAMGRRGEPYATDTLIGLLSTIAPDMDPKKKDLIMSCGEIISCALVAHLLDTNGIPAEALTGFQAGIVTNNQFTNSEIQHIDPLTIHKHLGLGKTVVVAGFQGMTEDMEITTLGRGGSDTTAVTLGGYLGAERVDIFTDVPGVAITDPRIVSDVSYLNHISFDSMFKLASHGAKVIHPRAVLAAQKFNIPLRVRSTFTEDLGTLIGDVAPDLDKKIIGISLEQEQTCMNMTDSSDPLYPDSLGRISIFFPQENKNMIVDTMSHSFTDADMTPLDFVWADDHVSILLPFSQTTGCVQYLYNLFQ